LYIESTQGSAWNLGSTVKVWEIVTVGVCEKLLVVCFFSLNMSFEAVALVLKYVDSLWEKNKQTKKPTNDSEVFALVNL